MTATPKRLAMLISAGFLAAAPAFADTYYLVPSTSTSETTTYYYVPSSPQPDTRTYYYVTEGAPQYIYTTPTTTVTDVIYEEPAITVLSPRLTEDQAITSDVVDTLASDPRLSGRIGVETRNRDVNLTGTVGTPGQIRRAVRDTRSVPGVDNVTSELRPRVGANTSY